jgi:REP element-mobilizing transposase RayT
MSRKYKFHNPEAAYFVSFATVNWIDVFTRSLYLETLSGSLSYCRKAKSMELFAYCFMPSPVHLIFRSKTGDPVALLRDFKKFTAKKILNRIEENSQESRKEWLLWMFERAGRKNPTTTQYQFWQQHNKPIELWSTPVIKQKMDYIHDNPVKAGFVANPEDWKYSSAKNFQGDEGIVTIDDAGFFGYIFDREYLSGTSCKLAPAGCRYAQHSREINP